MFFIKKSKKIVCAVALATLIVLIFSSYTSIASSESAIGLTLPYVIKTFGNAWNGEIAFDLSGNGIDFFCGYLRPMAQYWIPS